MGEVQSRALQYLKNLNAPVRDVRHSDLTRFGDSPFRSNCPACGVGILLVYRDQITFRLRRHDRCTLCAQQVRYIDDGIAGETFEEPSAHA